MPIPLLWLGRRGAGTRGSGDLPTPSGTRGHTPVTYTQHCFLVLGPPNLGLSKQLTQEPQSCTRKQPRQCPQRAILIFLPWWDGSDRRGVWARAPADPVGSESPPGPADSTFSRWDREGTLSVSDADDVSIAADGRGDRATEPLGTLPHVPTFPLLFHTD